MLASHSSELNTTLPTELVVFGATGDLSQRKLFPSLYQLFLDKSLPKHLRIKAVTRTAMSLTEFSELMRGPCSLRPGSEQDFTHFMQCVDLVQLEANRPDSFAPLAASLLVHACRIFYFAVPPSLYPALISGLVSHDCIHRQTRVVVEKPIGQDLKSAEQIHQLLKSVFEERQIFRIDHYLGKETVQNIMALRFGNAILEPLWCAERIDYIQITVAETLGVENRGDYYDQTGALRDMVQNHLLQLLCITMMEPPAQLSAFAVRDEKLKVLSALRPILPTDVVSCTVRGQYQASRSDLSLAGYTQEAGVQPNSTTETFVALKTQIDNWRWAGMPIYLRTGKRLQAQRSEILIQFKDVPHRLFSHSSSTSLTNRLLIALQPEESIQLFLNGKAPGKGMILEPLALNLDQSDQRSQRRWAAYERLILDVLQDDLTLFMREKEVSVAWSWIDPIIQGWQQHMPVPELYASDSWGPVAADQLLARDGYIWHNHT